AGAAGTAPGAGGPRRTHAGVGGRLIAADGEGGVDASDAVDEHDDVGPRHIDGPARCPGRHVDFEVEVHLGCRLGEAVDVGGGAIGGIPRVDDNAHQATLRVTAAVRAPFV